MCTIKLVLRPWNIKVRPSINVLIGDILNAGVESCYRWYLGQEVRVWLSPRQGWHEETRHHLVKNYYIVEFDLVKYSFVGGICVARINRLDEIVAFLHHIRAI